MTSSFSEVFADFYTLGYVGNGFQSRRYPKFHFLLSYCHVCSVLAARYRRLKKVRRTKIKVTVTVDATESDNVITATIWPPIDSWHHCAAFFSYLVSLLYITIKNNDDPNNTCSLFASRLDMWQQRFSPDIATTDMYTSRLQSTIKIFRECVFPRFRFGGIVRFASDHPVLNHPPSIYFWRQLPDG